MKKYELDKKAITLNNKLYGELYLENSNIKFIGKNNIIYIDGKLKLTNSSLEFRGDNSIIYICQTDDILQFPFARTGQTSQNRSYPSQTKSHCWK